MLRSTPTLPFQVLGEPETTVHAVDDTVSADPKGQVNRLEPTPSKSRPPPPRDQCRLASHPAPLPSLGGGEDARRADRRASAGAHVHMHVHVSLTFSSISTTPPPTTHTHRTTPLLGPGHARNDLQRHRQFEALIDARFDPAQERARRPRRPQGPGVANAQTSPKPHTRTALSTTTTTKTTVKDRTAGHRGQGGREAHLGRGRRASGGSRGARAHLSLLKVAPARNSGWLLRRGLLWPVATHSGAAPRPFNLP